MNIATVGTGLATGIPTPALNMQLTSATNLFNFNAAPNANLSSFQQTWSAFDANVAKPGGVDIGDYPRDVSAIEGILKTAKPLARGVFDRRAMEILSKPVTESVVTEQGIKPQQIKEAMERDIISEGPAMALINSALMVDARISESVSTLLRGMLPGPCALVSIGIVMGTVGIVDGPVILRGFGLLTLLAAIAVSAITGVAMRAAKDANKIVSKELAKLFPDKTE